MGLPWEIAAKKFTKVQIEILKLQEQGLNINRIAHRLGIKVAAIKDEKKKIAVIWNKADKEAGLEP
jgi:DNA-binding NarL/FixJ family response regulator